MKISVPDGQTSVLLVDNLITLQVLMLVLVHSAKAVAEGAVLYYIDGHVSSRVSKVTYGAPSAVPYNAFDPDHLRRTEHIRIMPSGKFMVNGGFEVVLKKVHSQAYIVNVDADALLRGPPFLKKLNSSDHSSTRRRAGRR